MNILTMTLSFVLALALAFGPFAALAEARGGGSGGGGSSGGSGATGGNGSSGPGTSSAGPSTSDSSAPSTSGSPSASPTASGLSSPAASPRMLYPAAAVPAGQTVTGEVVEIDSARGTFSLRTADAGTLNLQAAPSAVSGVKRGDVIVVEIMARPAP